MIGATQPVSAAGNGLWSVAPSTSGQSNRAYFNYLVAPGSVVRDSVFVTNDTTSSQSFLLYTSDAVNTPTGGFSLQSPQAEKKTVGKWTNLKDTEFTLAPHSVSDVPFDITVPTGAVPGDYAGGVVLRPLYPTQQKRGDLVFNVFQSVGTRIYLRVKGPLVPSLRVTSLAVQPETSVLGLLGGPTGANVTYTIKNTGNEVLNPVAYLKVSPLAGSSVEFPRRSYSSLLPGSSATFSGHIKSILPVFKLTAHLTIENQNPRIGLVTASASALVIPWLAILILALLILLFVFARHRRRRITAANPPANESAPAGAELVKN